MCSPSPPAPPDYAAAARTQGGASLQAAIANSVMNRPNEVGPLGSRTWSQSGSYQVPAAEGNAAVDVPLFQSTTNLSPTGQALQDSSGRIATDLASAGEKALGGVNSAVGSPLDLSSLPDNRNAITDAMYRRQTRLLDPQYEDLQRKTTNDLINRGFSVGGEAYDKAQNRFELGRDQAYSNARDQAITSGSATSQAERQQAINEILLKRQQPLAELASIRTGAAPQMPQFQPYAANANAQAAPLFQAAQATGNADMGIYNANTASANNTMSTIGSLGGAAIAAMF